MRATIRDVAKLAGVSIKTVSNVLNDYPYLTPETKGKVERALAELDYRPNISARNLRRGRTGLIALALPSMRSPYFAEIAHLIVKEAETRDLTVLIDCTEGAREREQLVAEGFRSHLIDGMILQPWSLTASYLRNRPDRTPLVLLGERLQRSADSVAIDSRAAAAAATEHLIGLGRRRIAVIGAPPQTQGAKRPQESGRRQLGYTDALTRAGLPFDPALVVHQLEHSPEGVAAAVDELLASAGHFDALFCFNDRVALGAIRTLHSRGRRVPEDVAVVGIDDIEAARLSTPSLSTISPDKQLIARTAVDMLVERIDGLDRPARRVVAEFELVPRESTLGDRGIDVRRQPA
ncbi:DNA-binding transcriptional regulator, LacI/PurR family [Actinopolymorpha cephalotaxi]|uniref:DNA-binding LacI/PurR family transcriptional regulator n=1 Tax=Actinopolymorpha cephalotaxi TaxID=504797 RepID=A0A1I2WWV2_9ACTN|nr:LacI family DNA-binding transcriptional regulator [Actinopolymorpha cephalotaxi]NYH85174.1 DNA-binding LacI/PurR family transcriptional regulator [Actinopolymorpha cephalotaxi]SFH05788.1 DNA-binding transcriptional regulator, LacI/PurR family [Actinopolymorpha cephalotaxi]